MVGQASLGIASFMGGRSRNFQSFRASTSANKRVSMASGVMPASLEGAGASQRLRQSTVRGRASTAVVDSSFVLQGDFHPVSPMPATGLDSTQMFDTLLSQVQQVHTDEIESLQKEINSLQHKIQQLAPGGKQVQHARRRDKTMRASINSQCDWVEASTRMGGLDQSAPWKTTLGLEKKKAPPTVSYSVDNENRIVEVTQISTDFKELADTIPEESTTISSIVAAEPMTMTPRNGAPTSIGLDPLSHPGELMAESELTSWVRNALKSELAQEDSDKAESVQKELTIVEEVAERTESRETGETNETETSQWELERKALRTSQQSSISHKTSTTKSSPRSIASFEALDPVIQRWRDLVLDTLALASKEMFVIKPCWVQSENFLRKAMRGANHVVDLFCETPQVYKQVSIGSHADEHHIVHLPRFDASSLIVDPQSPRRLVWSLLGMVLMIYDLVMLPMQAFDLPDNWFLIGVSWFTQIFWTLDMFVSAVTSYYVNGELEMRMDKILRCYAVGWFPIDTLITVPLWLILIMGWDSAGAGDSLQSARYVRMLRFLRLARLVKFESMWGVALDYVNSASTVLVIGMTKLMFLMILLNHLAACVWYAVGTGGSKGWALQDYIDQAEISYKYLSSMHWTLTQFQGTSEITPGGTLLERVYAVVFLLAALFILTIFISSLTNRMMQFQNLHSQRTYEERVVRGYLSNHDITHQLSVRIKKYLEWKQRLKKSQEYDEEVFNILPLQLMMDLLNEVRGPTCSDNHPFFSAFREAYPRVMRRLCFEAMTPASPMPGEQVFSPGDVCIGMYFILSGNATYNVLTDKSKMKQQKTQQSAATSFRHKSTTAGPNFKPLMSNKGSTPSATPQASNEELAELGLMDITSMEGGSFLSEAILWTFWHHVGSLDVVSDSMLLVLQPARFEEVLAIYLQAQASAVLYARRFVASLNAFGKHYSDYIQKDELQEMIYSHNDVMSDSDEEDDEEDENEDESEVDEQDGSELGGRV